MRRQRLSNSKTDLEGVSFWLPIGLVLVLFIYPDLSLLRDMQVILAPESPILAPALILAPEETPIPVGLWDLSRKERDIALGHAIVSHSITRLGSPSIATSALVHGESRTHLNFCVCKRWWWYVVGQSINPWLWRTNYSLKLSLVVSSSLGVPLVSLASYDNDALKNVI